MPEGPGRARKPLPNIVKAEGEEPLFKAGDNVKIAKRFPIGHFRVPNYIRGKRGRVEAVIEPPAVNCTAIPDDVEVRVHDSTAMVRFLVLPQRPPHTEDFSEDQLAALVTRDAMIGVVRALAPEN